MKTKTVNWVMYSLILAGATYQATSQAQEQAKPMSIQNFALKTQQNVKSIRDKIASGVLSKNLDPSISAVLDGVRKAMDGKLMNYESRLGSEVLFPFQMVIDGQSGTPGLDAESTKKMKNLQSATLTRSVAGFQKSYWDILLDTLQFDPALSISHVSAGYGRPRKMDRPFLQLFMKDQSFIDGSAFNLNYNCSNVDYRFPKQCVLYVAEMNELKALSDQGKWFHAFQTVYEVKPQVGSGFHYSTSIYSTPEDFLMNGFGEYLGVNPSPSKDPGTLIYFPLNQWVTQYLHGKCSGTLTPATCEALLYSLVVAYQNSWATLVNVDVEAGTGDVYLIRGISGENNFDVDPSSYVYKVAYPLIAFGGYQFAK